MYPWQRECVDLVASTSRSLVYAAPTGAGKSRVADELLELDLARDSFGLALVILPYVALVREKERALSARLRPKGIVVKAHAGSESGGSVFGRERCAVCTIEKGSAAVSRLIERDALDNLRIVVVDELHMVSEDERGAALEGALGRIRHAVLSGRCPGGGPRLVCMTATVARTSMERLARWLDAETYVGTHRPVELKEHIVLIGDGVYAKARDGELTRVADAPRATGELDVVAEIVGEVFIRAHSTLVFCSSKAQCSSYAMKLASVFHRDPESASLREAFVERLYEAAEGAPDMELVSCIRSGVAWHHAGLTTAEKYVIEEGFRGGAILALMCTTTLAAGVNLPARRCVILRGMIGGHASPSMAQYKQMAGRAGRKGQSDVGESFLIITNRNGAADWARNLVCGDFPPLESRLFPPSKGRSLGVTPEQRRFFLESIACGVLKSKQDAGELACRTFAWSSGDDIDAILARQDLALKQIHEDGIIEARRTAQGGAQWHSTPEGYAFYRCALPIAHARALREELDHALRTGLCLSSKTHLLFFCVSHEASVFTNNLNWRVWSDWMERREDIHELGEKHLGITREYAERAQHRLGASSEDKKIRAKHERLASAQLLCDLLAGDEPISELANNWSAVATTTGIDRGKIQSLQSSAATTAGMASVLCEQFGWNSLAGLLQNLGEELQAGAQRELLPLMRLEGMTGARARALYDAGFTTPMKIATLAADKFNRLQDACHRSLSRSKKNLDHAMRTTAWRLATNLARSARELMVSDAKEAVANLEV